MKKQMKIIAIVTILAMLIGVTAVSATTSAPITVLVGERQVQFADQEPVIVDGRVLVPVRGVFEQLGFVVNWDSQAQQVTLSGDAVIVITVGSNVFTTNGVNYILDVPAQTIGGRTMLPLRLVLESIGMELRWEASTQTVQIISGRETNNAGQESPQIFANLSSQGITNERLAQMVSSGEIPANIEHLNLAFNQISDISPLQNLTYLVDLSLTANEISDISYLSALTNLTVLDLWGNQVYDISPLGNLSNLRALYLWGNTFTDISGLAGLDNLLFFAMGDNLSFNGDISPISSFTSLEWLEIGSAFYAIEDFSPIRSLVNLQSLSIWGTGSFDLNVISPLVNLTDLTLHAARIDDYSMLNNFRNLKSLDLQGNGLTDISVIPIETLSRVTELRLWGNEITDVSPLRGLTNLRVLQLASNHISDITPLKTLTNLEQLDISGNRVSQSQIEELRAALPNCII